MRAACARWLPVLSAMLLLAVPAVADTEDEEGELDAREGEARKLIDLFGVYRSMDQWSSMAVTVARPFRAHVPPEVFEALEITLREGYSPPVAREILVQELSSNFDPDAIAPIDWWFGSVLGGRVEQFELAAGTPEGGRLMEAYSRQLAATSLPQDRREAAQRYDRATRKSEALALTLYAMNETIFRAVNDVAPEDRRLPPDQVDAELAKLKSRLPDLFQGFIITQLAYMQKDLSADERLELLMFAESDSAQWFFRNYIKGLDRALASGGERTRDAFRNRVAKQSD